MGVDVQYGQLVMGSPLEIVAVPAFADNYLWLVHDAGSGDTAVVDPGDPAPVLAEAARRGWRINAILNTHWHPDHTGGNLAIKEATGAEIWGPAGENGRVAHTSGTGRPQPSKSATASPPSAGPATSTSTGRPDSA